MPKITRDDIIGPKGLGFTREMFNAIVQDDQTFNDFVDAIIAEKALELEGRIGTTVYNDASQPNATYVKLAEKYLCAAEMVDRRINIVLGQAVGAGQEIDTTAIRKQKQDYLDKVFGNDKASPPVAGLIEKIVTGSGTDGQNFASGALVTSHFGEETT